MLVFVVSFLLSMKFMLNTPKVYLKRRQRDIDREVLFAGRYLLIKLQSGIPLFNALIDASHSYGVASKYFKEIVDEVNVGTPIETALENAVKYTPSKKFRSILWQILNALKTGIDITTSLNSILDQITKEQILEIKVYGKKLGSLAMFYMLLAIVVPSLGITMLVVVSNFMPINIGMGTLTMLLFVFTVIQYMFLSLIRSIRPAVNI